MPGLVNIPLFKGADTSVAGQYQSVNMNATNILEFSGNEAYGASNSGLTIWWLNTSGGTGSVVKNFQVWNIHCNGYFAYETSNLTIDGFVGRGNFASPAGTALFFGDYSTNNVIITNADIQGMGTGVDMSTNTT